MRVAGVCGGGGAHHLVVVGRASAGKPATESVLRLQSPTDGMETLVCSVVPLMQLRRRVTAVSLCESATTLTRIKNVTNVMRRRRRRMAAGQEGTLLRLVTLI